MTRPLPGGFAASLCRAAREVANNDISIIEKKHNAPTRTRLSLRRDRDARLGARRVATVELNHDVVFVVERPVEEPRAARPRLESVPLDRANAHRH
jgi:hypothetical protein